MQPLASPEPRPAPDIVLSARGLTREFRGFVAVNGVDLDVRRNTVHALIGPNGAGKTTCFNMLTGFLRPTRGRILFNGTEITGVSPAEVARRGLVRSFQISAVFPKMTLLENVRIALQRKLAFPCPFWRPLRVLDGLNGRAAELLEAVGLAEFRHRIAADMSYGRRRALEFATAMALEPQMLLLDEPMSGLGVEDIDRIAGLIRAVSAQSTVLMVEHNLGVVADLSDTITVLCRGEVLAQGDYATISADPEVKHAYMGPDHGV